MGHSPTFGVTTILVVNRAVHIHGNVGNLVCRGNHHARANCYEHDGEGSRTTRALAFSTLRRHRARQENRSFVAGSLVGK